MQQATQYAVSVRAAPVSQTVHTPAALLWIAIDFPLLALEALSLGVDDSAVVTTLSRRGEVVYQASPKATAKGIVPGMKVNAALAICVELDVRARDPDAERCCLGRLVRWASRFTPAISTVHPTTLLLEVSGSLKLFGGIDALYAGLCQELDRRAHRYCIAATPTPGASTMLAIAGQPTRIIDKAGLRPALHALPVHALGLSEETLRRLRSVGVTSLHELWRLPRQDVARRFGQAVIREADRILGAHPDPRETESMPHEFEQQYELEAETTALDLVLSAVRVLLQQLADFLISRDAITDSIVLTLQHPGSSVTRVRLGCRLPVRDVAQWMGLFYERMQGFELNAPVLSVGLCCHDVRPIDDTSRDLFDSPVAVRDWSRTLDELEARLGVDCVWSPGTCADHRPELAWCRQIDAADASAVHPAGRPLWLLSQPRRLGHSTSQAAEDGSLRVISGPERIESGWWDGSEYSRDYYTAICPQGQRLWVYRDLKEGGGWYVHGLFG